MFTLCVLAVAAALAGLAAVGLALGTGAAMALLAAPAFGAVALASGSAAAVMAMRQSA